MKRTLALIFSLLALLFGAAFAAGTAADTEIKNTAQATYVDSSGANQTATSNEVTTVVQKVYSLSITPNSLTAPSTANPNGEPAKTATTEFGQSTTGLSEGETFLYYTVTNTSNTKANETDQINLSSIQGTLDDFDFTAVGIYQVAASGTQPAANASTVPSVALGPDGVAYIAVKVKLPVLTKADNNKVGHLDLKGSFNAAPAVSDVNNWAQVTAKRPNVTLTKTASKTAVVPGDTITYTLSGTNSGDTAAYAVTNVVTVGGTAKNGFLIKDVIPSGLTLSGTPVGNVTGAAGTTASVIYATGSEPSLVWTSAKPATGLSAVGLLIEWSSPSSFPANATYSLSFNAQVPANAAATTAYNNTATLRYDANNDGDSNDPDETFITPPVTSTVGAVYSVAVGPQGKPSAAEGGNILSGTGTYTDPSTNKTWTYSFSGAHNAATNAGKDAQTVTSPSTVYAGDTVAFLNTIKNLSNAADTYTLTASSAQGYTVTLYQSDGTTLLTGPTASVPAGGTLNVVVKVAVPVGGVADTVTLTAKSTNDTSKSDVTLDKTPAPQAGFTFAQNESGTVTYSGSVAYTHTLTNNANTAATVKVAAPAITTPKGWTYTYSYSATMSRILPTPPAAPSLCLRTAL